MAATDKRYSLERDEANRPQYSPFAPEAGTLTWVRSIFEAVAVADQLMESTVMTQLDLNFHVTKTDFIA